MSPLEKRPSGSEVASRGKAGVHTVSQHINRSVRECSCGRGSTHTNTLFGSDHLIPSILIAQLPRQPQRSARISFGPTQTVWQSLRASFQGLEAAALYSTAARIASRRVLLGDHVGVCCVVTAVCSRFTKPNTYCNSRARPAPFPLSQIDS